VAEGRASSGGRRGPRRPRKPPTLAPDAPSELTPPPPEPTPSAQAPKPKPRGRRTTEPRTARPASPVAPEAPPAPAVVPEAPPEPTPAPPARRARARRPKVLTPEPALPETTTPPEEPAAPEPVVVPAEGGPPIAKRIRIRDAVLLGLAVAIAIAAVTLARLGVTGPPESFTQLWLQGGAGDAPLTVGIESHETGPASYRLDLVVDGRLQRSTDVDLDPGAQKLVPAPTLAPGSTFEARLALRSNPDQIYRRVLLHVPTPTPEPSA
jgi:hypothetical protein